MGYLAENLVYFMAEAVDRNGKKDPSLGMKNKWDIAEKTRKESDKAISDFEKTVARTSKVGDEAGSESYVSNLNKVHKYRHRYPYPSPSSDSPKACMHHDKHAVKSLNSDSAASAAHAKLMHKDIKKAHNESALFNDPIWDKL